MITDLIFNKFPVLYLKFMDLFCQSFLYKIIRKIYYFIVGLFKDSFIYSLFSEKSDEDKFSNSFLFGFLDSILKLLLKFTSKVINVLSFGTNSSFFIALIKKHFAVYTFIDFEFITGFFLIAVFICPGQYWYNVYGLAGIIVLLLSLFILTALKKKESIKAKSLGLPFIVFAFSSVIGIGTATDHLDALRVFIFFLISFMFTVLIIWQIDSTMKLKKLLGFIYASVLLTSVIGFVQRFRGVEVDPTLIDVTLNTGIPGRVFSTFENPNNYAEFLVLLIPFCIVYCFIIKNKYLRAAATFFMILPVGALIMTYSRSGWISFFLAALVFIFLFDKRLLPVFAVFGVIAIPLLPDSVYNRILTIGSTRDSSNMYRVYIWEGIIRMLKKYWVTGIGLGPSNFKEIYLLYCNPIAAPATHSHMVYLEVWLELGIVGILSYLTYIFTLIRKALINLKYANPVVRLTLIAGVSALIGIAFSSAAEYVWFYPRVMFTYFIVTGLLGAANNISKKEI